MPSLSAQQLIPIVAAAAAWTAAVFSWINARRAGRSLRISEQQEQRRQPKVVLFLVDSWFSIGSNSRVVAFSVSITNRSDSDNSISEIELELTYTLPSAISTTVKIPQLSSDAAVRLLGTTLNVLVAPFSLSAHQSVTGWLVFDVNNAILENRKLETHKVLFKDSYGFPYRLEQSIIREISNEKSASQNRPE